MKRTAVLTLALVVTGIAPAQAETVGTYLRSGNEPVLVQVQDGLLYCTRVSDGFEICNGMAQVGNNSWQGDRLKNPDMPRFISARGVITISEAEMALEGCVMGGSVCKSQTWPAQN